MSNCDVEGVRFVAKPNDEIAAEIVQAVIQARGNAIAGSNHRNEYLEKYLSDAAIAKTYKEILNAINNPNSDD